MVAEGPGSSANILGEFATSIPTFFTPVRIEADLLPRL